MQWLIDIIAAKVIATIGIPPVYIDRGDPASWDFGTGQLIEDFQWHTYSLASIVPAGASAVALFVIIIAPLDECSIAFRRTGNVNTKNISCCIAVTADMLYCYDVIVPLADTVFTSMSGTKEGVAKDFFADSGMSSVTFTAGIPIPVPSGSIITNVELASGSVVAYKKFEQ